jgi:hypothetical protein
LAVKPQRPHHRPSRPVWLGDQGVAGNIDPFILKADSIVAVLRFPINIADSKAVRERTPRAEGEGEMTGTPRAPWTPEQDKQLRALVLSANSVDTIAKALNRTVFAVRRRANTLRLPLRKIVMPRTRIYSIGRLVELGLKAKGK